MPLSELDPLAWDDFRRWFRDAWEPGQHVAVIAPTGAGKTTLIGGLLDLRRYVLALDAKGGDSTLNALGYERLSRWPGVRSMARRVDDNDDHGRPSRFIVGPVVHTERDRAALRETCRQALTDAFDMGGWTVVADELQVLTDPRLMGLREHADNLLIAARAKAVSFVSAYQSPRYVTPAAAQQASWVAVAYTRDKEVVGQLADVLGRPRAEIRGAMDGLADFAWMVVGRSPREPIRLTIPRKLI